MCVEHFLWFFKHTHEIVKRPHYFISMVELRLRYSHGNCFESTFFYLGKYTVQRCVYCGCGRTVHTCVCVCVFPVWVKVCRALP